MKFSTRKIMDSGGGDFGGSDSGGDFNSDDGYISSKPKDPKLFKPSNYVFSVKLAVAIVLVIMIIGSIIVASHQHYNIDLAPQETHILRIDHNGNLRTSSRNLEFYQFASNPTHFVQGYNGNIQESITVSANSYHYYHRYLNINSNITLSSSNPDVTTSFLVIEGKSVFDEWVNNNGKSSSPSILYNEDNFQHINFTSTENTDYYFVFFNIGSSSFQTSVLINIDASMIDLAYAQKYLGNSLSKATFKPGTILVIYNSQAGFSRLQYHYFNLQLWLAVLVYIPIIILVPVIYNWRRKVRILISTPTSVLTELTSKSQNQLLKHEITNLYQLFNHNYYSLVDLGFSTTSALEIQEESIRFVREL